NGGGGHGPSLVGGRRIRGLDDKKMHDAIRNGVRGTDMPPSTLPEAQLKKVVVFVRSLSAPAIDFPPAGNLNAGRESFFGWGGCARGHAMEGRGGFLGPDLTDAGASNSLSQLRESLLDPNKRIADGFEGAVVTLRDGRRIEGIAKNRDKYSVQI